MVVVPSPGIDILGGVCPGDVWVKSQKYSLRKEIESISDINGQVVVKFKDIHSIDAAFRLIGYSMYGEMKSRPEAADTPESADGIRGSG